MMYKTVRKGDASLQYTILPQSDQFNSNGLSQSTSHNTGNGKSRSRIIKYTIFTLSLIVLSCVGIPLLINQNDHNLFAGTILVMGRVGYETTTTTTMTTSTTTTSTSSTTASSTSSSSSGGGAGGGAGGTNNSNNTTSTSTTIENALKSDQISEDEEEDEEEEDDEEEEMIIDKSKYQIPIRKTTRPRTTTVMITSTTSTTTTTTASSSSSSSSKNKDFDNLTIPIDSLKDDELESSDTLSPDEIIVEEGRIPTDSSLNIRQTSTYLNSQSSPSSTPSSEFSKSSLSSIEPSEMTKVSSGTGRKTKMPRVTLKLRENETIPQMYMKAGIASYKKGNITTSVLAHGLSLEGLIFKTPEGTIKPWEQKWFFSDPSSDFQWKGPNQMPMSMYILLAGLAGLAVLSIGLMFYVQRKASRRQRHDIEEPETEIQEEDKSTLLGTDNHEIEDKD